MNNHKKLLTFIGGIALCFVAFFALDFMYPFPEHKLHPATATVVYDRDHNPLRIFLPADGARRMHTDISTVSPVLIQSLIASEDGWFEYHPGINAFSAIRAAISNIRAGRIVSGASTIPMQIARMADPKPRTLSAKLKESFRAVQLKFHHSNDELLEIYLNMLPYGGNIEGVAAASHFYFGHDPSTLSLAQSALLTTMPRGPATYDPVRHPKQAERGRNLVMEQLEERGVFPSAEVERNKKVPLPTRTRPVPLKAPHFSRMVLGRTGPAPVIETTLDYRLQQIAEERLKNHISLLRNDDIDNGACVIIHIPTREIRALVGSADFFEKGYGGAINLAETKRSPGSTLKPFLYALAMDKGLMAPASYLYDIPVDYSGYSPENYDQTWSGQVEMREALARSLNVPAVKTLAQTTVPSFVDLLRKGGLSTLNKNPMEYGLPLALGGCEVKLTELTNLYACLADSGKYRPYKIRPSDNVISSQLLSPEASWITLQMLSKVSRPEMNDTWMLTNDMPETGWKTGTSFGHRDAWAIGISGEYAIGVWVGNPDGRPRKGISGAVHAGPLLFDLLRAASPGGKLPAKPDGPGISEVKVCAHSHQLPGPFCTDRITMQTLSGKTQFKPCEYCRQIFIDPKSGFRLSGECLDRKKLDKKIIRTLPARLARWRAENSMEVPKLPPLSPDCDLIPAGNAPKIISPASSTPYLLRKGTPLKFQQISLRANAETDSGTLHWFLDGRLINKGEFDQKLFAEIKAGKHKISVTDSLGRTDSVLFEVRGGD
ncbi:MAG: penicillin-binding protein 1C [Desulfovibrio sp. S3730MH75]|nr:MAG: penicillin-binding protein 1C [Desulfovibrio sp. S3730MH75]